MTPAEHYLAAEQTLREAETKDPLEVPLYLAAAQVHATLACAQTLGNE